MQFDDNVLLSRLRVLTSAQWIAFAASCSERLFPNYERFSHLVQWGDPTLLRRALDEVWHSLTINAFDNDRIRTLLNASEEVIPDTEDFDSPCTSYALDAATAITETLQLCLDQDPSHAVDAASFCIDSIDRFIQQICAINGSDSENEMAITNHRLMQSELKRQEHDLRTLTALTAQARLNAQFVASFRRDATSRATNLCSLVEHT